MHSSLTYIRAQDHIADLRATADRQRLLRSAERSTPSIPARFAQIRRLLQIRNTPSSVDAEMVPTGTVIVSTVEPA